MLHRRLLVLALGSLVTGCHTDFAGVPANQSATTALGAGVASPLNAFIAVGDTVSLSLRAVTPSGLPVTTFDSVRYVFADPTDTQYVQLSPTGVVTGRAASDVQAYSPARIWIVGFKNGAWAADEAMVTVTATRIPHPVLRLLAGASHDTSSFALSSVKFSSQSLADASGTPSVSRLSLRYEFRSQDSAKVGCFYDSYMWYTSQGHTTIPALAMTNKCGLTLGATSYGLDYNYIFTYQTGTIVTYANALAYGVPVHDSVVVTVGNPLNGAVTIAASGVLGASYNSSLNPTIAPSGTVVFRSTIDPSYGTLMDIVFDHPEAATASPDTMGAPTGNIRGLIGNGPTAIRQFTTPGTYNYTAKITAGVAPFLGVERRGVITVQ